MIEDFNVIEGISSRQNIGFINAFSEQIIFQWTEDIILAATTIYGVCQIIGPTESSAIVAVVLAPLASVVAH